MEKNTEHKKEISKKDVEGLIIDTLKTIFDPEIPVNLVDLGLIYKVHGNNRSSEKSYPAISFIQ